MKTEENKRMLALSYIVADLKAENIELAQRVHQLVDDYNDVARQLHGKGTHKDEDPAKLFLADMQKMRDHCDKLERENKTLTNEYKNLELMYDELNEKSNALENVNKDLQKQRDEQEELIKRFNQAEFIEIGQECKYYYKSLQGIKRKVGYGECCSCPHLMRADVFGKKCLLCAYLYDNTKEHDTHGMMATDD